MDKIVGIVRHILTFAGGALVAVGITSAEDWAAVTTNFESVVGAGMTLVGIAASIIAKLKDFSWSSLFTPKS